MLGLSLRTIQNYMDAGKIEHFTLEQSKTRRITRDSVLTFLDEQGVLYRDGNVRYDVIYTRVSKHTQKNR